MKKMQEHEVVISGMSGVFPECDHVDELWAKLIAADENMVTVDDRLWTPGDLGVPPGIGKLRVSNNFDMSFFGISRRLSLNMDPLAKMCLEQSYRAVCDAGVNPAELSGAKVAVLMASAVSETEYDCVIRGKHFGHAIVGHSRCMMANRISYFMNLTGPSMSLDSSWCGGVQGLQNAHDLISKGLVTSAIVGACSLIFKPEVSAHYQAMGRLSQDSKTRSLSGDASGYARSEGCTVFFLQRRDHARRSYGTILSALSLNSGSKIVSHTEICEEKCQKLLLDSYKRAKVSPNDLAYLEVSGSASIERDARELRAVSNALLPSRSNLLPVGCIKSNLGHCEAAASMMGAVKVALILDRGLIPPNINFNAPNPNVPALLSGNIQVVTKPTPLEGNIGACTEIGVSGELSHLVLKRHDKVKKNRCKVGELPLDGLPRLVLMSDRSNANLEANRERLHGMAIDEEFVSLMNHVYKDGIKGHLYRGYSVLDGTANSFNQIHEYQDEGTKRPIWFMFSGMGSQWPAMGKSLMRLPIFASAIQKCHDALAPKGVNVLDILTNDDPNMFDTILHSFVGIAAVQIGLVDVLKALGIEPDGIVGHSVGELGCAYADGCFTAEQMILSAHARGRASVETKLIRGMMAAIGKGYHQIKNDIPDSIEVACHNSDSSCTLSGPAEDMVNYIDQLKKQGVFAKLVNVANIAYHSRYIKPAAPALLKYLKEVIPVPKPRSTRWVSSSIPESEWKNHMAQTSSAEYHTNNLLGSVLFEEASSHIPPNAIVIEIAPHGLLQAIVRRSLPNATHIPLTSRFEEDNLLYLLGAIGKMYMLGVPVSVQNLYPAVEFPVSRDTPAISPFIGWQHLEEFEVKNFAAVTSRTAPCWKELNVLLTEEKYSSLDSHKINQRIVLPPSFYIGSILESYSNIDQSVLGSCIEIENLDFGKEVEIPHFSVQLTSEIHRVTGNFVFYHCNDIATRGKIVRLGKYHSMPLEDQELTGECLAGEEVTSFMNSMGLSLSGRFAAIKKLSMKDHIVRAIIKWNGSIMEFLNCVFTVVGFYYTKKENELRLVSRATKITINLSALNSSRDVFVEYNAITNFIKSDCVQVLIPRTSRPILSMALSKNHDYSIETIEFLPYSNASVSSIDQMMYVCTQLLIENLFPTQNACTVRVISIGEDASFYRSLDTILQSLKGPHVLHMASHGREKDFHDLEMSFIHQETIWIVSSSRPSHKVLQCLNSALCGFIFMPKYVGETSNVNVIMELNYKGASYVLGSVMYEHANRNYVVVNKSESYLEFLKVKLENAAKDNLKVGQEKNLVILAGKFNSITSMLDVIEDADCLPHGNLLRYVFSDQEVPQNILSDLDYCNQILKGLKLNIFMNGVWGSLRLLTMLKQSPSVMENVGKAKFIYPLNSLMTTNDVNAVGLNLTDVTGTLGNDSLGIFDYVTPTTFGLAEYNANVNAFIPDRILKWRRPKSWTDSEAATVPLLYCLAATIVHLKNNALRVEHNDTILVTNGLLPLSQAIIMLALHENLEVFATVGSVEEKTELLSLFPRLVSQNILDHSRNDFYMHIQGMKAGRGVAKAVCTLDENNKIEACAKSLDSEYGIAIVVGKGPMDGRYKLGMSVFFTEAIVVGVTSDTIISSSDEEKLELRDKVQTLISNGVIKPFKKYSTLPSNTLNVDAVERLKRMESKVVVTYKKATSVDDKFICDKSKSSVIICGQRQLDIWLDLVEWLLKRDARKVTVFLKPTGLSTSTNLRYQSLTKKYYGAKVNVHSVKHISSKLALTRYFDDIEYREGLDTIFFIGNDLRGKIHEINAALEQHQSKCRMVCLGQGGETVCHKRNVEGLSSLCVRCSTDALGSPDILRYLEQLIIESTHRPVVILKEKLLSAGIQKSAYKSFSQFIPETLPELTYLFSLSSSHPAFASVRTNTARLPYAKEVSPVFIVPGLKPHQTSPLCNALYYPALEARLPEDCSSIETVASKLVDQMISRPMNFFTLVADGWSGILALHMGSQLEALGRTAKVILLGGSPQACLKVASELLKDETALIDRYLKLSPEAESNVRKEESWGGKLQVAVGSTNLDDEAGLMAAKSINLLRNRLLAVLRSSPPLNMIQTKCHLFEHGSAFQERVWGGLNDYLVKEHTLHLIEGDTIAENMALAADDVNRLVLFEYKDAAVIPKEALTDMQILNDAWFDY